MLDLDIGDLDSPGIGLLIENLLDVAVQPVTFRQHLVEVVLAEHGAQGGLRELAGRRPEILDLDDRALRIDDAEIEDGTHLDGNIVARDHILWRHVFHHHAQINPHHLLDERNEDDQAGSLHAGKTTKSEDDTALIFPQDANGRR